MKKIKHSFCHRCQKLLGKTRYISIQTDLGNVAFCEDCIREGYLDLIGLQYKSPQIQMIIDDFKKFLVKFKISIDS